MRCTVFCLTLALSILPGRAAAQDSDAEKLAGNWVVTGVSDAGKSVDDDRLSIAKINFDYDKAKGQLTVTPSKNFGGFSSRESRTANLEPSAKPHKTFDLPEIKEGDKKADAVVGIYQLEGDVLKLAVTRKAMGKRPENFETTTQTEHAVYTLARENTAAVEAALNGDKEKKTRGLKGVWIAESGQVGGRELPKDALKGIQFVIEGNKIKHNLEGGDDATMTLSVLKAPFRVDFENRNKLELAIFELILDAKEASGKDDVLKLCIDTSSTRRPGKFESPEGTGFMVLTLKREIKNP